MAEVNEEEDVLISAAYYSLCKVLIEHAERQGDQAWLQSEDAQLYIDYMRAFEEARHFIFIEEKETTEDE